MQKPRQRCASNVIIMCVGVLKQNAANHPFYRPSAGRGKSSVDNGDKRNNSCGPISISDTDGDSFNYYHPYNVVPASPMLNVACSA